MQLERIKQGVFIRVYGNWCGSHEGMGWSVSNFNRGDLIVKKSTADKRIRYVMHMHKSKVQIAELNKDGTPNLMTLQAPWAGLFRLANQHERLCRFRIDDLISHLGLKDARDILNGSKQSDVCKVELQRQWDAWHIDQEQTQRMENGFKD